MEHTIFRLGVYPRLPMSNTLIQPTFAECYCAKYDLPREAFARTVMRRALYRRTHFVRWLLPIINENYFAADYDLIYAVEHLSRLRDFATEAERFNEHPANRGWLRRTFCLRVSTSRLKEIIRETMPARSRTSARPAASTPSEAPFEKTQAERHTVNVHC